MSLYEPIFAVTVILSTGNLESPLNAFVQTEDHTDKNGRVTRKYRVHIEDKKDFYGLLHETVHLVKRIMVDRGIPFNAKNDEVIAYLQTYWFKKLWRKLNN